MPLLISVNINNFYIASIIRDQTSHSNLDVVSLYLRQIDTSLTNSYLWLINQNNNIERFTEINNKDETKRIYADVSLFNGFHEMLKTYPAVDTVFAYTPQYDKIISASGENVTYSEKKLLWNFIKSIPENQNNVDSNWILVPINGKKYFFNIKSFEGGYLGIITKPETIKSLFLQNETSFGEFILSDNEGEPLSDTELKQKLNLDLSGDLSNYYLTGSPEKQLIVGESSMVSDFRLLMVIPDKVILQSISWVYIQSIALMLASIAVCIGIVFSIYREVLNPINNIVNAILHVGQDNFTIGITPKDEAWEYTAIYNAFNKMVKEIEDLKIDNYEERIKRQQAELHFYQMQIKPHFILNCLTTISNLVKLDEKENLISFISDFSNFSRYLLHTEFTLTSLKDEISQIEHYINIQKTRYPGRIFLMADVPDECYNHQIPTMILQTLVENSVKHGMNPDFDLCIFIQCREIASSEDEEKNSMLIVEDTGNGLSSEMLEKINDSSFAADSEKSFGVRNVKAILELNYNGKAKIVFKHNEPKGVRVEIELPKVVRDDEKTLEN